jgi:hypothetical protein
VLTVDLSADHDKLLLMVRDHAPEAESIVLELLAYITLVLGSDSERWSILREGEHEQLLGTCQPLVDQPDGALDDDARLAGSRPRENNRRPLIVRDGRPLVLVAHRLTCPLGDAPLLRGREHL